MAIFKPYSEREKERLGQVPDVYEYDKIPREFRFQVTKTWERFFGASMFGMNGGPQVNAGWKQLRSNIAEYYGVRNINENCADHREAVCEWFGEPIRGEVAIDVLDISVNIMSRFNGTDEKRKGWRAEIYVLDAVKEINRRFRQHGIGYEFVGENNFQLIRKDNEHLHRDVVLPALQLIGNQQFAGVDEEYRSAHEHYRHGRYEECLTDCLKAFESTMKIIIARRRWTMPDKQIASALIKECLTKGLLGPFMDQHLGNFQSALESGVPTVRNKLGAHGQGEQVREVPAFYPEYMLHETAVTVVLLVNAFKALPPLP